MQWSKLPEGERAGKRCATHECSYTPTHRFEAGGVGSVYCHECMTEIVAEEYGDDHDDDYELDPMEEAEMNCSLGPDGQCGQAGTEHCDFCCPFRMSEHFADSPAWRAKHAKG